MAAEFYRDEHPEKDDGKGQADWKTPGSWGYGWGGGNGGGTGGGSSWSNGNQKLSVPVLKISHSGLLLLEKRNRLLHGSLQCRRIPAVLICLSGDGYLKHWDCALTRLTEPSRKYTVTRPDIAAGKNADGLAAFGHISWFKPGKFTLQAKWQAGHYSHAKIGRMKFIVYGVSLGWQTVSMSAWRNIATIEITDNYQVLVNGLKARLDGNSNYLEK